jgi:hypothetical protein
MQPPGRQEVRNRHTNSRKDRRAGEVETAFGLLRLTTEQVAGWGPRWAWLRVCQGPPGPPCGSAPGSKEPPSLPPASPPLRVWSAAELGGGFGGADSSSSFDPASSADESPDSLSSVPAPAPAPGSSSSSAK